MPKLVNISVSTMAIPRPASPISGAAGGVEIHVVKAVVAVDDEGNAWELDRDEWRPLPRTFNENPASTRVARAI